MEATAINTRTATPAEVMETTALQTDSLQRAMSLQDYAVKAASQATGKVDEWKGKAVKAVALRFIAEQASRYVTEGEWSPIVDAQVWGMIATGMALEGTMIWRDTNDILDRIEAETSPKAKRQLAAAYANRKGEFEAVRLTKEVKAEMAERGETVKVWKLADSVADLKTDAITLRDHIVANHEGIVQQIAFIVGNGDDATESVKAAIAYFGEQVDTLYGAAYRKLHASLVAIRDAAKPVKTPKAEKPETAETGDDSGESGDTGNATGESAPIDKIATIMAAVATLSDDEFIALGHALKAHAMERSANRPADASEPSTVLAIAG